MIARVPNKIRTHKRASVTNFVVVAMPSGFSAPMMFKFRRCDNVSDFGLLFKHFDNLRALVFFF